uniref:Uncharacterized protein n=1 Tax=Vespula pensylvanica TaxID=30213 RepID=A0A834UA96_VESPE|nr:hypothetical protein H0235_007938 [Vespula pensylvanica]
MGSRYRSEFCDKTTMRKISWNGGISLAAMAGKHRQSTANVRFNELGKKRKREREKEREEKASEEKEVKEEEEEEEEEKEEEEKEEEEEEEGG